MSALPAPALAQRIPACSSSLRNCALLTLSLGHQIGWALQKRNGEITQGTIPFKPAPHEGAGMGFLRFKYWLDETSAKSGGLDAVIYADQQIHSSMQLAVVYGGFLAHLTAWGDWRQIPHIGVLMSDVRKFVIGHDDTVQQTLVEALRRRGYMTVTKDTSTPLALLEWALHYKAGGKA